MNLNVFTTIDDFRSSELWERINTETAPRTNTRILSSMRIEDKIYNEMRDQVKIGLDEIEADGAAKLDTFSSLIQDSFMSLYSLNPRHNDNDKLTTNARHFNTPILDYVMNSEQYPAIKSLCEGNDLVAYEAVNEFTRCMVDRLDELLDSDAIEELNILEHQQSELKANILDAMEHSDPIDTDGILDMANNLADNEQRIKRLTRVVSRTIRQNRDAIQTAVASTIDKAQEASNTIKSWGNGDSSPAAMQQNIEMLRRVQSSPKLQAITKYLGRFRQIFDNACKSSFIYGRGEKYDIVLGDDFTRAVSSEYVYIALPETILLFIQKVQQKALKQYRRREHTSKGYGDIVVCIDESGSMGGNRIAWAKAVALVLLEHAVQNNRSCAMVRFASAGHTVTHIFSKGKYTTDDVFNFAESFLQGGTDFETPLKQAITLIETEGFENADVIFITDGECIINDEFASDFHDKSKQLKFNVTGIIIDTDETDTDSSLTPFCKKVYHLSNMAGDSIASDIITSFVR